MFGETSKPLETLGTNNFLLTYIYKTLAVMAEWLRRQTRNLLGSARAGSNPADCAWQFWEAASALVVRVE